MFYGSIFWLREQKKATKIHKSLSMEQNKGDSLRTHHLRSREAQENRSADKISKNP